MTAAALAQAATDSADPTTWLQAVGGAGLIAVLAGLLVWLLRLIIGQGKGAREDSTQLRADLAGARKENERLDAEIDTERKRRFAAEDREHTAVMECARLQQIIDGMRRDDQD